MKTAIIHTEMGESEVEDPLFIFFYALRTPETKRQYPKRLKVFLDYLGLGGNLQEQAKQFLTKAKQSQRSEKDLHEW